MTLPASDWSEIQLLVACVSNDGVPYTSTNLQWLVSKQADWGRVLTLAGFHGLLPILTNALDDMDWDGVPAEVRKKLLQRNAWHVANSVMKMRELQELNHQFESRQLELVNWKGLTLAASLYPKPTLRESCDFDFLVAEHEVEDATEVLTSLGFKRHIRAGSERVTRLIARYDAELCFVRERDHLYVELHTEFLPRRFGSWQDIRPALNRASMQDFPGGKLLTLHPEDLLLSLCAHGIKHYWARLKWLADIARFAGVYRSSLDWRVLLRNMSGLGQTQAVLHSFLLAEAVFGVRVPEELSELPVEHFSELTARRASALLRDRSGEISEKEMGELLGLLFPGRMESWLFALRRLSEPQESDIARDSTLFPQLAKIKRLRRQVGWAGIVEKVKVGFDVGA